MTASSEPVGLAFVDTNVLVYALSEDDLAKRAIARALIAELQSGHTLRTSAQVLSEFFVIVTRKVRKRLTAEAAVEHMEQIGTSPVVVIDFVLVVQACQLSVSAKISYWDALIVAAAARAGAKRLYSEDLNAGQEMLGVKIINPFQ